MYNYVQNLNKVLSNTYQRCSPSFMHSYSSSIFYLSLLLETLCWLKQVLLLPSWYSHCVFLHQKLTERHFGVTGFYTAEGKPWILKWMPRWLDTECISALRLALLKQALYSWCQLIAKTLEVLTKRSTNLGEIMKCVLLHLLNISTGHRYRNTLYKNWTGCSKNNISF